MNQLHQILELLKTFILIRIRQKFFSLFIFVVIAFCCTSLFWVSEFIKTLTARRITDAGYYSFKAADFEGRVTILTDNSSSTSFLTTSTNLLVARNVPNTLIKSCVECKKDYFVQIANQLNPKLLVYLKVAANGSIPAVLINATELPDYDLSASFLQMTVAEALATQFGSYTPLKEIEIVKYIFQNTSDSTVSTTMKNITDASIIIYFILLLFGMLLVALFHCRIFCQFKETRYMDLLFRNGLSALSFWTSVYIIVVLEAVLISVAVLVVYIIQNAGDSNTLNTHQQGMLVFTVFFMYMYLSAACFLFTSLMRRFIFVAICSIGSGTVVMVLMLVNQLVFTTDEQYISLRNLLLVIPIVHIPKLQASIMQNEDLNNGYLKSIIVAISILTVILIIAVFYLDNILSNGNGLKLKIHYIFNPKYWSPKEYQYSQDCETIVRIYCQNGLNGVPQEGPKDDIPLTGVNKYSGNVESVSKAEKPVIHLNNVCKSYERKSCLCCCTSSIVAVNDFTSTIYKGQITCLIGHNGAGKTSLFKVMVGQEETSSGSVKVGDVEVTDSFERLRLRGHLGICEQFDVLSPNITVWENIKLVLMAKGMSIEDNSAEIETLLSDLDLIDKKDVLGGELSGGQKRKVCTIIALAGNPAVVFLDEPTSGLDPVSRRKVWKVLQDYKKGRSIILSTHFMDEADILADRKIFIATGKLICAGSSLFLKHKFGCGPVLNVTAHDANQITQIKDQMKSLCPHFQIRRVEGTDIEASLLMRSAKELPTYVEALEKNSLVASVGLSQTTLDDIFMKIKDFDLAKIEELFSDDEANVNKLSLLSESFDAESSPTTSNSILSKVDVKPTNVKQFTTQFHMNLLRLKRRKIKLMCRIVFPIVLVLLLAAGVFVDQKFKLDIPNNITVSEGRRRIDFCVGDFSDASYAQNITACPLKIYKLDTESLKDFLMRTKEIIFVNATASNRCDSSRPCSFAYMTTWDRSNISNAKGSFGFIMSQQRFRGRGTVYLADAAIPFLALFGGVNGTWIRFTRLVYQTYIDQFYIQFGSYALVMLMAILPVTFLSDPIEDKQSKVRHQLSAMGMSSISYWLNTLILHMVQYSSFLIISTILLIGFFSSLYGTTVFVGCVIVPLLVFGIPGNLIFLYFLGSLMKRPQAGLTIFLFFVQLALSLAIPGIARDKYSQIVGAWVWPPFTAMQLLFSACKFQGIGFKFDVSNQELGQLFFRHLYAVNAFIAMIVHLIVFSILLYISDNFDLLKEKCCGTSCQSKYKVDPGRGNAILDAGVSAEKSRVESSSNSEEKDILKVCNLQKVYSNGVPAVKGVTFGAKAGEVFALLGPNGAGKSTTLSIAVGEEMPTDGTCNILYNSHYVNGPQAASKGAIGYCPQHNPLLEDITVEEHLRFYAKIRGVPNELIDKQIDVLIKMLSLTPHATKDAQQLSGGNKRRLCLAIALLGNPSTVVIDEASTGVDPETKRSIWKSIQDMKTPYRTIVVTTHSMEEVEALASRVAIMNRGEMIAFGTTQYLKQNYGETYTLEILLRHDSAEESDSSMIEKQARLISTMEAKFKNIRVLEKIFSRVQIEIPKATLLDAKSDANSKVLLSKTLNWINSQKAELSIQFFSLYQASLDQIFVNLIRKNEGDFKNKKSFNNSTSALPV